MQVEGVLASIIFDDFFEVGESMLKSNPEVQALCKEYGIESMDSVAIDPWPSAPSCHTCMHGMPCCLSAW
jgi:Cu2+-containing amine oxidase